MQHTIRTKQPRMAQIHRQQTHEVHSSSCSMSATSQGPDSYRLPKTSPSQHYATQCSELFPHLCSSVECASCTIADPHEVHGCRHSQDRNAHFPEPEGKPWNNMILLRKQRHDFTELSQPQHLNRSPFQKNVPPTRLCKIPRTVTLLLHFLFLICLLSFFLLFSLFSFFLPLQLIE